MKAMVLAAGEGRRLRPLTDSLPKALVPVAGVPMLEVVLRRLARAGVRDAVVNTFHLAERVEEFLRSKDFGLRVEVSREKVLLDTGGGLLNAAGFFDGETQPFFLYNADVLTDLPLAELRKAHLKAGALATLAVSDRPTSRHLIFDGEGALCGRETASGDRMAVESSAPLTRLAFNGVHVISPALLKKTTERNAFSIMDTYLRLAAAGERVQAFRMDRWSWNEIGSEKRLAEARTWADTHGLPD